MICMKCNYNDNSYETFYSHACFKKLQREFNQRLIDKHNEKESKMISAKQAREITDSNNTVMNQRLERIGKMIEHEAKNGNNSLLLDAATDVDSFFEVNGESFNYTSGQMLLKRLLEKIGYKVAIEAFTGQVRGTQTSLTSYFIVVRW